jgi:hypothetical protein
MGETHDQSLQRQQCRSTGNPYDVAIDQCERSEDRGRHCHYSQLD